MVLAGFVRSRGAVVAALAISLSLGVTLPSQAQPYTSTTVMSGLFNPRGLTVASDGSIYVAEAGAGGNGTQITGPEGDSVGYGNTSGVSRLTGGIQSRLLSTLPSLAAPGGGGATGLSDIIQGSDGFFYGVIGLGADPARRGDFTQPGEFGNGFGRLVRFDFTGAPSVTYLADLAANEFSNPDGTTVDSNPTSIIETPTGFAVTDAGANALLNVTSAGGVSTRTVFPAQQTPAGLPGPPFYQAVPTAVAYGAGSQGTSSLFVSQLTGFPFPQGGASIYEVNPLTGTFTTLASGFTTLIDLTYANGYLYALELTTNGLAAEDPGPGNLWRVDVATGNRDLMLGGLFFPGGVAVGQNDDLYVSVGSVIPGGGSVLRVTSASAPEPGTIAFMLLAGAAVPVVRRRKRTSL